jgi:nucleotide-binding universal stress UspA family protein
MSTSDLLGTKMLLATDGSEEAELATRAAIELAEGTASELHVVYVEPWPEFMKNGDGTPGYDRELYEMIEEKARETLRKLTWRVKVAGGMVEEAHLRMGGVAEEIVGLADELNVGLVVVGSRGLGRIRRALAGSVSESVFRHAHCPVMVVRAKGKSPNRPGGGRPRVRRLFSQDVEQASSALAPAKSPWRIARPTPGIPRRYRMVWVATTATEDPASTQEGSEVNGFLEKVLLATDGLENTVLADRAAVDLAKKGDAKRTGERRNHEAFAP